MDKPVILFVLAFLATASSAPQNLNHVEDFIRIGDMLLTPDQYQELYGKDGNVKRDVRLGDMILTDEQYKHLYGKSDERRDVDAEYVDVGDMMLSRDQYKILFGHDPDDLSKRSSEYVRVGDMMLTKQQYKYLYGDDFVDRRKRLREDDVRIGDMILTKDQYEHLYGKKQSKRSSGGFLRVGDMMLTRSQYEVLFGKDMDKRSEDFVRVGDLMLTKDQYKMLFQDGGNRNFNSQSDHDGYKRSPRYSDHIRVGDMLLTKQQHEALFPRDDTRSKRKAVEDITLRWTNGVIPYEFFENDFSESQKKDARVAFDFYEQETCLKFRPSTPHDVNKTVIRQGWGGCNSELGMVGGAQNVNLDNNGCRWFGLYLHEFGHALGLVHEHQLPERDQYLEVLWNNINPGMRRWFKKYTDSELRRHGVPYDLSSVMHYELNAFSKLNMRGIRVKDPKKDDWIGRVYWKTLSFTDVKLVNRMYRCNAHCPAVACPDEGFINKDCKCVTPREYFDHVCVNDKGDDDCNKWAVAGECGSNPGWMHINCRRACNGCPRFGVDDIARKEGDCWNKHVDDALCDKWAAQGLCDTNPSTVKRWCRKSCKACNWEKGRCPNFSGNDVACDRWASSGECEANPRHMKAQCADSCGTCDWKPRGKCANKAGDKVCAEKDKGGICDKLDPWMMENCAATCDTCGFNAGACKNELPDKECIEGYIGGECVADPRRMKKKCRKTCNTCEWGKKGACKDRFPVASHCENWAVYGSCEVNPGWMALFCASSCNTCDYPGIVANRCFNSNGKDQDCKQWADAGECDNNPEYMRMNCQKACNTCHFTKPGACFDLYPTNQCQTWRTEGKCDSDADWMLKGCTKTCNRCNTKPEDWCADEYNDCKENAAKGWCDNVAWMKTGCRRSCGLCDKTGKQTEQPETEDNSCADEYHDCKENAAKGWCDNVPWMKTGCRRTCGLCDKTGKQTEQPETEEPDNSCADEYHDCKENAAKGWCDNVSWMKTGCRRTCGLCGKTGNGIDQPETGDCVDENQYCAAWASAGHCYLESVQMVCHKSCQLC